MGDNLRIDGERLWSSLMEMARIGATEKGGVCRIALTDLDRQGRDLFVRWCKEAGCQVRIDAIGNIFARRSGRDNSLPPIVTGSHLDSQPTGGKFDGAYGVLAGLEVIRALNDAGYETQAPIEVVVWTNEEGARFAPAMVASGVFAGAFDLDYALSRTDPEGKRFGDELERIGYAGPEPVGFAIGAYFEAHIEQGPILENRKKTIGIVTGGQGQRWHEIDIVGMESHAGTTPMALRKDALVGAAELVVAARRIATARENGRATVGVINALPQSRNTIPGRVAMTLELRNPSDADLTAMDAEMRAEAAKIAAAHGLEMKIEQIWYFPPQPFDAHCVEAVRQAAAKEDLPAMEIVSGAGHDACYIARVAPAAMVFIPCEAGISHNEIETATPGDAAAGCQVLLQAMVARANA
ncbi:MAG: Zn-dependent hydrolase [Reyranellaceae bacterium]